MVCYYGQEHALKFLLPEVHSGAQTNFNWFINLPWENKLNAITYGRNAKRLSRQLLKLKIFTALYIKMECFRTLQLSPKSVKYLFPPCHVTTCSNIQILRMKETITKDEMF